MRILLVTHGYPPLAVTGVERLSEQTAVALTTGGHRVTVLARHPAPVPAVPQLQRMARRGVDVLIIAGGGHLVGHFPKHAPTLERLFERTLLEVNPDVVLISHLINHSPMYVSIARRWGVPVVLELHDFYMACERAHLERFSGERCMGPEGGRACATHCFPQPPRPLERWALRTHIFRHALTQADALTCPSQFVAEYVRDTFGPELPPLHVVGNGVEAGMSTRRLRAREDRGLHLACVGVVARHKGTHVVLEALRMARLREARLTLFGPMDQSYFEGLRRIASSIEHLRFRAYGIFEPAELPGLLGDVDIVVVPSLVWETYSIVAREAMACGIPVLASRLGALPEAVRHGENGLLFEPGSANELATILQMIDRERALVDRFRAGIRPSDWISVAERTSRPEAVLDGVLRGTERGAAELPELSELSILRDAFLGQPAGC